MKKIDREGKILIVGFVVMFSLIASMPIMYLFTDFTTEEVCQ